MSGKLISRNRTNKKGESWKILLFCLSDVLRQQAGNIPDVGGAAEEFQFRLADAGAPQDELGIGVQRAARFDSEGGHFREGQDKDFLFPSGEALYIDGNDLAVGDDA